MFGQKPLDLEEVIARRHRNTLIFSAWRAKGKPTDKPGSVVDSHSSWRPVARTLQHPTRKQREPRCRFLRGLAPDGVYPATRVAAGAVRSYRTFSPLPVLANVGGLFSVALSVGLRRPGVTWRSVLWSPDFPPYRKRYSDRPAGSRA